MTFLSNHHQIPKAMLTDIEKARIIKRAVCEHYGMDMSQLCTRSHKREYADVRNVIYYFLRTKTGLSLREMGGYFDRDHATAYHGHRNTENLMRYNGFGKTVAAFVIGQSWKKFNTAGQPWVRFTILFAASCLSSLSLYLLFWLMQRSSNPVFPGASVLQALITAGLGIILFAVLETYKRIQTNKAH